MSLKEVCRACLSTGRTMYSLLESIAPPFDLAPNLIVEQWELFTKMLTAYNDSFPDKICIQCLAEILQTYSFIVKCERSENILKQMKNVKLCLKKHKMIYRLHEDRRSEDDVYPNLPLIKIENFEWDDRKNDCYEEYTDGSKVPDIQANIDDQVDLQSQRKLFGQHKGDNLDAELFDDRDRDGVMEDKVLIMQDIKHEPELDICVEKDEFGEIVSQYADEIKSEVEPSIIIFKCPACRYECRVIDVLEKHIIENHMEGQMCKLCNQEFECRATEHCSTHLYLKIAEGILKSTTVEHHKCEVCLKIFDRKYILNKHLECHTGERQFKCGICHNAFLNKKSLRIHLKRHGEGPFKCKICSKILKFKSSFMEHVKCHTGDRPFKCDICPKSFQRKTTLTQHFQCHTGDKPFKCEICSKAFRTKHYLRNHLKCHTGDKPFKCEICSKAFRTKHYLRNHLKWHTGKNLFKCELCQKGFVRKDRLSNHLKFHT